MRAAHTYAAALAARAALLLLALAAVAAALVGRQPVYGVPAGLAAAGLVAELAHYLGRRDRDLADFLAGLRYDAFSQTFATARVPAATGQLRAAFNQLNHTLQRLSRQKATQHQYLQQVLALVQTGILSFYDPHAPAPPSAGPAAPAPGDIRWLNESLQELLAVPYLNNLRALARRDPALHEVLLALRPGESRLVQLRQQPVLLSATAFTEAGRRTLLVAFQPLREAVQETEAQAYQKLLRVLTHELMNSVAPIASLADSLLQQLAAAGPAAALPADLARGMAVIRQRSENLLHFAHTYRHLSRVSVATFQLVTVWELLEHVLALLEPTFAQRGIEPEVVLGDTGLRISADPALIEQVLLNLLANALDALRPAARPQLRLLAHQPDPHHVVVEVVDNGVGIPLTQQEEIFVPFFTTKPTGSGIGLSLSRQIMQLHRGSLQVQSMEGEGSRFQLFFPLP